MKKYYISLLFTPEIAEELSIVPVDWPTEFSESGIDFEVEYGHNPFVDESSGRHKSLDFLIALTTVASVAQIAQAVDQFFFKKRRKKVGISIEVLTDDGNREKRHFETYGEAETFLQELSNANRPAKIGFRIGPENKEG